jgi:RHS repeat-associated protein
MLLAAVLLVLVPAGSAAHLRGARSASEAVVPSSAISYGYDSAGRLAAVSDPSDGAAKYAFDAVGNLTAVTVFGVTAAPKILSFSPTQGAVGATVTIFGTGFSATASQDTVKFNGTVAAVPFASATQLVVTVPNGATSGAISVTSPNGTVSSSGSFSVSGGVPAISGFSPAVAATGSTVTVSGSGFDTPAVKDVLAVGQARSQIASASGSSVSGPVEALSSGHMTVGTLAGSATSSGVLFVPPSSYTAAQVDSTMLMAAGDTKTLSVSTANHIALAAFDGSPGERVAFSFSSVFGSGAANVWLVGPNGAKLKPQQYVSASSSYNFVDPVVLPSSGTYTLVIAPQSNATGTTTFSLLDVPADVSGTIAAGGSPVTFGTTASGQNGSLTFSGSAGQRVSLNVDTATSLSGGCACGRVSLIAPDGSTLVPPTYFYATTNGQVIDATPLPSDGTYTLFVDPQGATTGSARYTLYNVPADTTGSITPGGAPVTVSFGTPGQNARLTFTGAQGERISAVVDQVTLSCCSGSIALLAPDGSTVASASFSSSGGLLDALNLPQAGTYTLLVNPSGAATGSARVTLYDVPADVTGQLTQGGSSPTVSITTPGQNATFTFSGIAGENLGLGFSNVTIGTSTCCSVNVTVKKPDGSQLGSTNYAGTAGSSIVIPILPVSGTYTVFLDPQGSSTGSMTVTLSDDATASMTVGGGSATLDMSRVGQNGRVTFSGSAGENVGAGFSNVTVTGSTCCSVNVTVLKPDGTQLGSTNFVGTSGSSIAIPTLPSAGTYTIFLDPQGANAGSATVTLTDDATAAMTVGGSSATLDMSRIGQNGRVTFTGTAGERIGAGFSNVTVTGSTCCSVNVTVWKPDGTQLGSTSFVGTDGSSIVVPALPVAGTYTIRLDPQGTNAGSATVTLSDDATAAVTIGGAAATVDMSRIGQNGRVTFTGSASQTVHATFSNFTITGSSCCSTIVQLLKPDGTQLGSNMYVGSSTVSLSLPTLTVAGTYTLFLDPQGTNAGRADVGVASGASLLSFLDASPLGLGLRQHPPLAAQRAPELRRARVAKMGRRPTATGKGETGAAVGPPPPKIDFDSPESGDWIPTQANLKGNWRRQSPETPWQKIGPLRAAGGVTALSGQVLALNGVPLSGVTLELEGSGLSATSDDTGRFLIAGAPGGHQVLVIDGASASTPGKEYGRFEAGVDLIAGRTNVLDYTIWMPRLDKGHAVTLDSPTSGEVVVKTPRIPGLELHLQPGTVIKDGDGNVLSDVSITAVPVDRPPFPLPVGVTVPVYFTIQPGGAYLSKPAELVYPNYTHLPPGQRVDFWNYDPDEKGWYVYGHGTVSADASKVVPDADTRIWSFTGAMISSTNPAPNKRPCNSFGAQLLGFLLGSCGGGGDPIDLASGLFVYRETDLYEPGPMPIALTRTYRQGDTNTYAFGKGTTLPWDLRLWSQTNYTALDLIFPDGATIHYTRVSPGTGFTDAIYKPTTAAGAFQGSTISYDSNRTGWNLKRKDGSVFFFGDVAPLQSITDRFGNTLSILHANGQSGNITEVASSSGRWIKFSYSGSQITQATDNAGRTVSYAYDGSLRLTTVTDPNGGVASYGYDSSAQMTTVKTPRFNGTSTNWLTNTYTSGRVTQQTLADGSSSYQFAYQVDGNGNVTQTTVTDPNGNQNQYSFNADRYLVSEVDALGKPEQQTTSYQRDSSTDLITQITDPLGRATQLQYDSLGNLASLTRLAGTGNAVTTSFTYDPTYSQLTSVTDPLQHTTTYGYNSRGALTSVTDPLQHAVQITPNVAGQPTQIQDAIGHARSYGYLLGDLVSSSDALGDTSTAFLDPAGRVTAAADPLGRRTLFSYDPLGDVTQITDPAGAATTLAYDGDSNLTSITDAKATPGVTTFAYTNRDQLQTRTDPLSRAESYQYDPNGNLSLYTDRKGQKTRFKYDALDRRILTGFGVTNPGASETYTSTISYSYDGGNRLRSAVDSLTGTISDDYDGLDRLTQEAEPNGTLNYSYDNAGRRSTMTVAGQPQISYGWDAASRLTGVSQQGGPAVSIGYDAANRRTSLTFPNGIAAQYGYDDASRLTSITYQQGATTLGDLDYNYDASGAETAVWGSYARTNLPAASTATYDAANQLTAVGGNSTANDNNGSLTDDGAGDTYTWNNRGQLATAAGAATASFSYDAFGRRVSKTVNGTTTGYLYDGPNVVQELDGTSPSANLLTGLGTDETFSRTDSIGRRDLLTDALGSTIALTDNSGSATTSYTYAAYGAATTTGATSANSFQYSGRETDATGLVELRDRYYSPTLQRFLSQDPTGLAGGLNLYAYTSNNPLNYIDPSGLFWKKAGLIAAAGLIAWIAGPEGPFLEEEALSELAALSRAEAEISDETIIARGGVAELPAAGEVFSGAQGQSVEEAAAGIKHGQIRVTTAGDIRAGGGTVVPKPELDPNVGAVNHQHVDICLGTGDCLWDGPYANPIPKSGRFGGPDYPYYKGYP